MTDTKKLIELAAQDLTAALVEHSESRAAAIGHERIEAWHNLFKNLAKRVETLENAGSVTTNLELQAINERVQKLDQDVADELRATHDGLRAMNRCISAIQDQLDGADRRIADLEMALNSEPQQLKNVCGIIDERIADLEKALDDRIEEVKDDTRSVVADMINDGDIRLHVD